MAETIILFHYIHSPYAKRVVWYLNLRGIQYTQCLQPLILPRPDLSALGTNYRRIPVLAIGRDIYNDTRLILQKLEELYPASAAHPALSSTTPRADHRALECLLERWTVDGGVFVNAAQLLPSNLPAMKDPKFVADRSDFSGRSWDRATMDKNRPNALVEVKAAFELLESTLLADERKWILDTENPSLADIQAVWPLYWVRGIPGALPTNYISKSQFPRVYEWIKRFDQAASEAATRAGKARTVKGNEALSIISGAAYANRTEAEAEADVDGNDPTGLKRGDEVSVWPIDSGFNHKDRGRLVVLNGREIVIESRTRDGHEVRIHAPRHGFRVRRAQDASKL